MVVIKPMKNLRTTLIVLVMGVLVTGVMSMHAYAQDESPSAQTNEDEQSEQVERRDEQYRRQMELEDAQRREDDMLNQSTYADQANMSKLAKLPKESQ